MKSEKERKGTARSVRMIKPRGVEGKEGGGGRGEEGERQVVVFILCAWEKGFPWSSNTRLPDPPEREEVGVRERA